MPEPVRYTPMYWEKYQLAPPVQFPVTDWRKDTLTLRMALEDEIKRLRGEMYRGQNNGPIMRQIEDAEAEWEKIGDLYVQNYTQTGFQHKVAPKKPPRIGGLSVPLIESIQKRRGVTSSD